MTEGGTGIDPSEVVEDQNEARGALETGRKLQVGEETNH